MPSSYDHAVAVQSLSGDRRGHRVAVKNRYGGDFRLETCDRWRPPAFVSKSRFLTTTAILLPRQHTSPRATSKRYIFIRFYDVVYVRGKCHHVALAVFFNFLFFFILSQYYDSDTPEYRTTATPYYYTGPVVKRSMIPIFWCSLKNLFIFISTHIKCKVRELLTRPLVAY